VCRSQSDSFTIPNIETSVESVKELNPHFKPLLPKVVSFSLALRRVREHAGHPTCNRRTSVLSCHCPLSGGGFDAHARQES